MGPITDEHKLTYQLNFQLALQQLRSKNERAMTYVSGLSGRKMQVLDLIGTTAAIIDLPRKSDTPDIDNSTEPVWMRPRRVSWGKLMDVEDTIKAVMNHQSAFIQSGAKAMVRGADSIRRDAIFGARLIGQDGASSSSWAGDTVAVGIGSVDDVTATGMNVKKFIRGIRYMQSREVDTDMEIKHAQINAQGMEELYRDLTYVNKDYRDKAVLEGKTVRSILDIDIEVADGAAATFPDYDASTFTFALWCKSGVHWGDFDPMKTDIPLRPDKMNQPHPQSDHWLGATRGEDYKVVKILSKK